MVRIAGLALGRFAMADGRPPDQAWMAAQLVEHFRPGTVPILTKHRGIALGYLDRLQAEGPDLRFGGEVVDYPDIVERLRAGAPVSIETSEGVEPPPVGVTFRDAATEPVSVFAPHYRGTFALGYNLLGVALSLSPAAPGSLAWLDGEDD